MSTFLGYALLLACACLMVAALVPTLDWIQCSIHHGGMACRGASQSAREAWLATGVNLISLAYQDHRQRPRQ